MRVEVLVATMHQKDFSLYKKMNIQTDAVFANQDDRYEYCEETIDSNAVKMITTGLKGSSQNRIISLLHSDADICLLADDDIIYSDGYEAEVLKAFNKLHDADIIIFNAFNTTTNKPIGNYINEIRRLRFYRSYGSIQIAFKRNSISRKNIWFHPQLCAGQMYSSGEDSLFIREAIKKGLKIYLYPYLLTNYSCVTSSWFTGYNREYFFNKGAFLSATFPITKYFGAIYFAFKFKKLTNLSLADIFGLMVKGMHGFANSVSFEEWSANEFKK